MLLDVASIHPDRILLLDAFFSVVIFHGSTIAAWRKQGFHEQPAYASFQALLEACPCQAEPAAVPEPLQAAAHAWLHPLSGVQSVAQGAAACPAVQ